MALPELSFGQIDSSWNLFNSKEKSITEEWLFAWKKHELQYLRRGSQLESSKRTNSYTTNLRLYSCVAFHCHCVVEVQSEQDMQEYEPKISLLVWRGQSIEPERVKILHHDKWIQCLIQIQCNCSWMLFQVAAFSTYLTISAYICWFTLCWSRCFTIDFIQ